MPLTNQLNGDIAIIRDYKTGQTIAKATITKYDKACQVITLDAKYFESNEVERVSMLVLTKESIIECQGVVRKYDSLGYREIALFNAKEKESRNSIRYMLHTEAVIENFLIAGKVIPIKEPIVVMVENLSSSGALLSTSSNLFNVRSSFQLKLNINGNNVVINTSVVRIVNLKDGVKELGCSFISVENHNN